MPDGSIRSVYCHSDGYPSWNGRYLMNYWHSAGRAAMVTSLGDLSSLGKVLGKKHDFDWRGKLHDEAKHVMEQRGLTYDSYGDVYEEVKSQYPQAVEDWCLAYHRDRGDRSRSEWGCVVNTVEELAEHGGNYAYCYLWRHETWWVLTAPPMHDDDWERDPERPDQPWSLLASVLARDPDMAKGGHRITPGPAPFMRRRSLRLWDEEANAPPGYTATRTTGRRPLMI